MLSSEPEKIHHRAAIAGTVTDAITQQSIQGAVVEIEGQNLRTLTREDGSFYFIDLPRGKYNLKVSAPKLGSRYGTANIPEVTVQDDHNGRPIFDLKAQVKLPPTRLVGQLKRSDNNQPIARAIVQLRGSETQTLTDKEGRYTLLGLQAGKLNVQVSAKGFQPETQKVTLTTGQETKADFNLTQTP